MSNLIDRQAAIDAICKACSMDEDYHKCDGYPETSTWCDYLVALRALPSAQPERPKGHWIDTGSGQECSECGEVQYGYDNFRYYCAKCGSDNRGK